MCMMYYILFNDIYIYILYMYDHPEVDRFIGFSKIFSF